MRSFILPITLLFTLAFLGMLGVSILDGDIDTVVTEALCLLVLWIPMRWAVKGKIQLPWPIVLGIALALSLHALGLVTNWYITTFWWDKITHLTSGIVIAALVATLFLMIVGGNASVQIPARWLPLLILISVLTLGAFWEIIEFSLDHALGTTLQYSLQDTVNDIVTNGVSGVVAGLGTAYYVSRSSIDTYIANLRADKLVRWLRRRSKDRFT